MGDALSSRAWLCTGKPGGRPSGFRFSRSLRVVGWEFSAADDHDVERHNAFHGHAVDLDDEPLVFRIAMGSQACVRSVRCERRPVPSIHQGAAVSWTNDRLR